MRTLSPCGWREMQNSPPIQSARMPRAPFFQDRGNPKHSQATMMMQIMSSRSDWLPCTAMQ